MKFLCLILWLVEMCTDTDTNNDDDDANDDVRRTKRDYVGVTGIMPNKPNTQLVFRTGILEKQLL